MKIYFIMLLFSLLCEFVILIDTKVYINKHYVKVAKTSVLEKISGYIKAGILVLLIIPTVLSFLCLLFVNDSFIEGLEKSFENNEDYIKRG